MVAHALIFDLDGTVWDSAGWFASALAADNPAELSLIRNDLIEGCNITALIRKSNITRVRLLREAQRRNGAPPVFDGMREAIQQLTERGIPLAVVTSLPGTLAVPMLEACDLATSFPVVVHAGTCRVPKPHPASILKALALLNCNPSAKVFYVGDRATDAMAAERAGISAVWMRHGYEQPPVDSGIKTIGPAELMNL